MDLIDDKVNFRGKAPVEGSRPIRLGGSVLGPPRHICAFFNTRDDEYRVLLPFIKDGLECGEKAVHTIDPERHDEHLERLARAGIDVVALAKVPSLNYGAGRVRICATAASIRTKGWLCSRTS